MSSGKRTVSWRFVVTLVAIMVGLIALQRGWLDALNTKWLIRNQPGTYVVQDFRDGDTVTIHMNGTTETVRFIGVDTPETHKKDTPVQCGGPEASAYTKERIGQGRIRLVADRLTTNRDRYDRLLRYIYLEDGTDLNYELVSNGHAFAYAFPFANTQKYAQAMENARAQKRGLWAHCQATQDPITGQWHSPPM